MAPLTEILLSTYSGVTKLILFSRLSSSEQKLELLISVTSGELKWWLNELLESLCDVELVNSDKFEESMELISSNTEESVLFDKALMGDDDEFGESNSEKDNSFDEDTLDDESSCASEAKK